MNNIVGHVIFKLLCDLQELGQLLSQNSKLARRLKPFVIFSSLEASSWLLVFALQEQIRSGDVGRLSLEHRSSIMGLNIDIDETGSIKQKTSRLPVLNLILFALRSLAAFRGQVDFDPRKSIHWPKVEKLKKLRDRVAHPKGIADIEISDDELNECENAVFWLWEAIQKANGPGSWIKVEALKPEDFRHRVITFGPEGTIPTDLSDSPSA
jgi:hypothetical protein